ncbi:MAG TPA: GAF domain-containing protein [Candidatus Aquilonibacter sp.]
MRWRLVALSVLSLLVTLFTATQTFGGRPGFGWWDSNVLVAAPYTLAIVGPRPGGATDRAGLRAGDRLDLREQSLASRIAIVSQPSTATPTIVTAERGGTRATYSVIASTDWEGAVEWKVPVQLLSGIACLWFGLCALLLALRKSSNHDAQLLILALLCITAFELDPRYIALPSATLRIVLFVFSHTCLAIAPLLLLRLSLRTGQLSRTRTTLALVAVSFVCIGFLADMLATIGLTTLWIDPLPFIFRVSPWRLLLDVVTYVLVASVAMVSVRSIPAHERPRAAWLLLPLPIALALAFFTQVIAVLITSWVVNIAVIGISSSILILSAALVTYALLKRRVLDFEFVLSRTIVVATVSLIIVASFVLLEFILNTVLSGVSHATGLVANAVLALVLGITLNPIHKRVDLVVDGLLFHKRLADEQALTEFGREAAFVTNEDALLDRAIEKLEHHTDARSAAILLDGAGRYAAMRSFGDGALPAIDENDAAILALKAHHDPIDPHQYASNLHGALALPMLARGRLCGIMLLGERAGGEAYAPDEIAALSQMAQGVGSAIDVLSATQTDASVADAVRRELAPLRTQLDAIAKALRAEQP